MTTLISDELEKVASASDFDQRAERLTEAWRAAGVGREAISPILRFMEKYPNIDYGLPGSLVHFVEGFFGDGYEDLLLESVTRTPTPHTVWMVNRVINGAKLAGLKQRCLLALREARLKASDSVKQSIDHFLALN